MEALDANSLYISILCGSFGMGMLIYGKNMQKLVHVFAGLALMVSPYVIASPLALIAVALILVTGPFLLGSFQ